MNKHLDRLLRAFKPGPRPHALVKQMVEEQGRWNDLFSTKLIEVLDRVDASDERESQFRLECTQRIGAVEDIAKLLRLEIDNQASALQQARAPHQPTIGIWACSLLALLFGLAALAISLRGL
jgi:hypothetical protein